MRLLPSMNDVFNDFFDDKFFAPSTNTMRVDIAEKDGNYVLNMELPGYHKDDVKISLKNGYLNVSADASKNNEEKDKEGNVIRSERYHGACSRSFYVGDEYKPEDIKAKFENGELIITLPKAEKSLENKNDYIAIE